MRTIAPSGALVRAGLRWGSFPQEGFPIMVIGRFDCGGGPVDGFDWTIEHGAVDFSPGGVRNGYIRRALWERSLTDVAPVTGSLVFSTLLDRLDIYCTAEFASCWLFCGTDCVWLAGFGLSFWRVGVYWTMATEGAALMENRAGITFGVELYPFGRCRAPGVYSGR